jgi:MoaA/NifB/PqqE/SkfB family radical SAM enzyme
MAPSDAAPARRLPVALIERQPARIPREFSDEHTLLVTFGFRCNLACPFCMVEDVLGVYEGAKLDVFRAFLEDREAMERIRRVTFSGGEATLEKELFEYARLARRAPGVEHVRVQTNATRLKDRDYLAELIDAGVDEFFVSIHGHEPSLCDQMAGQSGSFRMIMAGIEAIAASKAKLLTNTVIVAPNAAHLADIVALVAPFGPRSMDFWSLWPRIDQADERALFIRVTEARPYLFAALSACEARGIMPIIKWFPHCLLGPYARYHDDSQPTVLVEQSYWEKAPRFACLYEGVCEHAPSPCAGLSFPYIHRFGWEEDVLVPARRGGEGQSREATPPPRGALERALERLGFAPGADFGGWQLRSARVFQGSLVIALARGGGEGELLVRLHKRDPGRPCYARTGSFDVVHDAVPPREEPNIQAPLAALVEHIKRVERRELARR